MNTVFVPALSQTTGAWRAIYWEPVMSSGERLCVGCVTTLRGVTKAHRSLRSNVLPCLYGAGAENADAILDRTFAILNKMAETREAESIRAPFIGIHLGDTSIAHANTESDLIQIALLMSSSICNLADPGQLEAHEIASDDSAQINRQFLTRVKALVTQRRPEFEPNFNVEAKLLAKKRPVRFGFLSDRLVAHVGLLQAAGLNRTMRNARGLLTEVRMARVAREGAGTSAVVLGHPPLLSATLGTKERTAIADCLEELYLEAQDMEVELRTGETDESCAEELLALA